MDQFCQDGLIVYSPYALVGTFFNQNVAEDVSQFTRILFKAETSTL